MIILLFYDEENIYITWEKRKSIMAAVIKRRVIRRVGEVGTWLRVSLRDGVPSARNSRVRDATSRWRHRWRNSSASDAECHKVSTRYWYLWSISTNRVFYRQINDRENMFRLTYWSSNDENNTLTRWVGKSPSLLSIVLSIQKRQNTWVEFNVPLDT